MIRLEGVEVAFGLGTQDERRVLRGVELEVPKGQRVSVIGSNGAGKTTLLNAVAGSVRLAAGRVLIDGSDRSGEPEWMRSRCVGRVRQDPLAGTAGEMSVLDNLAMASRKGRRRLLPAVTPRLRRELAERVAELGMGLEERLRENVNRLSGGQRQALTLLMAALARPAVLLLDEHTAALDPRNARIVTELTRRLVAEHGLTSIAVTHDMGRALEEADRLLMMHEGRIVADLQGAAKEGMDVEGLVALFGEARGGRLEEDGALLR
ncbi:MAG TPA: ATP-binding cassette domain-containing protein [Spirochaetales bacterium]|nr:ATP-binding cassette domain-containing protein [Spirochaetales bacterium]HRY53425.1 ATP-binding cassette domain-containing protein [Spirochaetia bacterium]HRZ63567.1 ATP-binding cassette domain-containing protein [Spirochaetia bacterium]